MQVFSNLTMQLQIVCITLALFGNCLAGRHGRNRVRDSMMMLPMGMPSDMAWMKPSFLRPQDSEINLLLNACLNNLPGSVDVVIDVAARSANDPWRWNSVNPSCYDASDFVHTLSKVIPDKNLYSVFVDGKEGNQTRYYLTVPSLPEPEVSTTTPAPVTKFVQQEFDGGQMMGWYYQQSFIKHDVYCPKLKQLLNDAFYASASGQPVEFPTEKNETAPATFFTVVITDSSQNTKLSKLTGNQQNTVILDIGGKVAASERNYLTRNLLVVPNFNSLRKFNQAVQFMICQAAGGNTGQVVTTTAVPDKTVAENIAL